MESKARFCVAPQQVQSQLLLHETWSQKTKHQTTITNKKPKLLPKEYAKWQMTQVQKEDWGPGLGDLSHLRGHGEGPDLHGGKMEDKEWTTSPSWVTWSRI